MVRAKTIPASVALAAAMLVAAFPAAAAPARADLRGRILLQVEDKGQAWYVQPDGKRVSLGRPADAFTVMRTEGVGISNANIWKIPIGFRAMAGTDADGDGLTDAFESAIGTDPTKADSDGDGFSDKTEIQGQFNPYSATDKAKTGDAAFAAANSGRIFLQVESHGEAWWVNPVDHKRYFLGRPTDAFDLMRGFGLGASNNDINAIDMITLPAQVAAGGTQPSPTQPAPTPTEPPYVNGYSMTWSSTTTATGVSTVLFNKFAEYGPYTLTTTVDDAAKKIRKEWVFADARYVDFSTVTDTALDSMDCRYLAGAALPQCMTDITPIAAASADGLFPSLVGSAVVPSGATRVIKTLLGHQVPCYQNEDGEACYYNDNDALTMRITSPTRSYEATAFTLGRPAASVFDRPADYDAMPDVGVSGPSPIGSGYTMTSIRTPQDPEKAYAVFSGVQLQEKGPQAITDFVDDVGQNFFEEIAVNGHRYTTLIAKKDSGFEIFGCYYDGSSSRPRCETTDLDGTSATYLASITFPSLAPRASNGTAGDRAPDRTIAGHLALCYGDSLVGCFYNNLLPMKVYENVQDGTVQQAQAITIGRPDASVFTRPAVYDALSVDNP